MAMTELVFRNGVVPCLRERKNVTARDCIQCDYLKLLEPREGGRVQCRDRRENGDDNGNGSSRQKKRKTD